MAGDSPVETSGSASFKNAIDSIKAHFSKIALHYGNEGRYTLGEEDFTKLEKALNTLDGIIKSAVAAQSVEEGILLKKMYSQVAVYKRTLHLRKASNRIDIWDVAEKNAGMEDNRIRQVSQAVSSAYQGAVDHVGPEVSAPDDGRDDMATVNFDTGESETS